MNFAIEDNFNVNIHEKMNNGLLNYMYMTISFQKKKMVCTCISRVSIQSGVRAAKEENDMYMYITGYIQSGVRAAKEENDMYMCITS